VAPALRRGLGRGNTDFAYQVFADDYVRHDLRATQALPGPAGQKKIADEFRRALPDLRVTVDRDDLGLMEQIGGGVHAGAAPDA